LSDRHAAAINQLCSDKLGQQSTINFATAGTQGFTFRDLPEVQESLTTVSMAFKMASMN